MTYHTAQRFSLQASTQARLLFYTLEPERLLELASAYVRELEYLPARHAAMASMNTSLVAGGSINITVPIENGQPEMIITIGLSSNGDIRRLAASKAFLTTHPSDLDNRVG